MQILINNTISNLCTKNIISSRIRKLDRRLIENISAVEYLLAVVARGPAVAHV
jgi:hypothetical protein